MIDLDSHKDSGVVDNLKNQNEVIYKIVKSGNKNSIIDAVEGIHSYFGDIHYLICSYYIDDVKRNITPEDLSLETWDKLLQNWIVNYFLVLKAVVPLMIQADSGRIVFFNTTTGYTGEGEGEGGITLDGSIHESACSSGITGMMTSIAADIIPQGVSVNGIALGPNFINDPKRINWTVNFWLSGLGKYSCGQILRLY